MILQHAVKGIGGISASDAQHILAGGIICNWWRKVNPLPDPEIPLRLTERNLDWHQNRYDDLDPLEGNEPFGRHTPFISLTAGTVERDALRMRNVVHPAWLVALEFATDGWRRDGYLFYCYVFILGRRSVPHRAFAEEIRELNIYTGFSPFQPEGEISAKINIPPTQIERFEFYEISRVNRDLAAGLIPRPTTTEPNLALFRPPDEISNVRALLI